MKKLLIFLGFFISLASCGNSWDIEQAKKAMLEPEVAAVIEADRDPLDISDGTWPLPEQAQDDSELDPATNSYMIEQTSGVQLLQFDPISTSEIQDWEVEFSWETLWEVDRITVSFSNASSSYPDDLYELKTFKSGWKDFKYLASSRFNVLDYGINTYVFTAYAGRESVETTITVNLIQDEEIVAPTWETQKLIGTEVSAELSTLPVGGSYGNPLMLGEDTFTYSDINGLEIKKVDTREIACDTLTDYLSNNINTWFYWNTCRDLIKDKAISFYVLRLDWDEQYIYQKHYVDFVNSFYGIYDLETGTQITKENIQAKNTEFKDRNDSFTNTELTDNLFKDIVN